MVLQNIGTFEKLSCNYKYINFKWLIVGVGAVEINDHIYRLFISLNFCVNFKRSRLYLYEVYASNINLYMGLYMKFVIEYIVVPKSNMLHTSDDTWHILHILVYPPWQTMWWQSQYVDLSEEK